MAVMMPRATWTDKRLDEFAKRVDERFEQVDKRFDQVDARLDRVDADIRELRKTMTHGFFVLAAIIVAGFAGQGFF